MACCFYAGKAVCWYRQVTVLQQQAEQERLAQGVAVHTLAQICH
jgi:hypothetical protein